MKIFITRELAPDSAFRQRLVRAGGQVYGQSLIEFSGVDWGKMPPTDWIFFYSRKAVTFFWEGLRKKGEVIGESIQLATLGQGTAAKLTDLGYQANFVGTGNPGEVAEQFLSVAEKRRVLFPRAENSQKSMQKALHGKVVELDLVVYKNEMRKEFSIPKVNYLVFTSPMNAKAYFQRYAWTGEHLVAIGETTAAALRKLVDAKVYIADQSSEESLAETVIQLKDN